MAKFRSQYPYFLVLVLLLAISTAGHSRPLISDGVGRQESSVNLLIEQFVGSDELCEQTYGFMPCTKTVWGNLFLILVYGYLMYLAATYLSDGSELLLELLGPGIIGGLFLPVLGSLPDAMLILVSGLSGSTATAQSQVSVGMGLLAGSTIMLLTAIWGSCVIVGKCDIRDSIAIEGQNTKQFSLIGSGVSTDIWTCYAARIMAISVVPFIIVQIPEILQSTSGRNLGVLMALILALLMLISYCLYQVFQPWIQSRRIAFTQHKHVISGILDHFKKQSLGRLLTDDGVPNKDVIKKLFAAIDVDHNDLLSANELRALVIGIQFDAKDLDKDEVVDKLMKDFDTSRDSFVDETEFVNGITRWLNEAKREGHPAEPGPQSLNYITDFNKQAKREHDLVGVEDQSDDDDKGVTNPKRTSIKAVLMLVLGTVIAAVIADPLVDAVDNFSDATEIPSFFISFIALPLATNSSEAVSAIIFSSRKKLTTTSLSFSELYGSVTMNNLLCLSVFLALVYFRGLTWDFSSEVLVILIVCLLMGAFASFRTTFPLWTALVAFILYPFSLALVYVLDYVYGWT